MCLRRKWQEKAKVDQEKMNRRHQRSRSKQRNKVCAAILLYKHALYNSKFIYNVVHIQPYHHTIHYTIDNSFIQRIKLIRVIVESLGTLLQIISLFHYFDIFDHILISSISHYFVLLLVLEMCSIFLLYIFLLPLAIIIDLIFSIFIFLFVFVVSIWFKISRFF